MNVGIILPHVASSQLKDEVFDIVNAYSEKGNSYTIFFENVAPNYRYILAPLMNIADSKFFKGRLIGFTLSSTDFMLRSFNEVESVLYAYDMEFLRGKTDFISNNKVYRNPELKILTRSNDYKNLLQNYSNRTVDVISLEQIMTVN